MFDIRKVLIAAVAALVVGVAPALLWAQNSELPLQEGQVRQEEVAKLVAVLQSDAPLFDKAKACQRLAVIGTKEAVPALAALLSDEKLAHYARYGLEPISAEAVDEALREALGELEGRRLVGVINSIGNRKDAEAVDDLSKLLSADDSEVAAAAAAALGRIGSVRAAKILQQALSAARAAVRPSVADACLACAEALSSQGNQEEPVALYDAVRKAALPKHLRVAATRGAILARESAGITLLVEQLQAEDAAMFGVALRAARELAVDGVTQALLDQLDNLPPEKRALVILALGDRGDAAALPAVLEAAKTGPANVRIRAFGTLLKLGDASAVPVLLDAAVGSEETLAEAAQATLVGLRGREVDAAIVAMLDQGDGSTRQVAIKIAGRRRIASAAAALEKAADDPDDAIRLAAIKALGETIGLEGLPALTGRVISPKSPEEKAAAQEALKAASIRIPDREACAERLVAAISEAPVDVKIFLLELLGSVGGTNALKAVSASAKDPNAQIQDAATRILGQWMSADAAPVLLDLAKTLADDRFKIRALRGYIRIARQLALPADERLAICREAMELAERNDERKLVWDVLRRNPSAGALSLAASYLNDRGLKGPASAIVVSIAETIVQEHPAEVAQAMEQVLQATRNSDLINRAKALLERAEE